MKEMQYQFDLMNAMNEKLKNDQKMMEMIIGTSTSAFIYYSFTRDETRVLGRWDSYFNFNLRRINEIQRVIDAVEEKYQDDFVRCINVDRRGDEKSVTTILLSETRKWIDVDTTVLYDSSGRPTDKVIRFYDVTRVNTQNEELKYMAYYDVATGLFNRNYFIKQLTDLTEKARKDNKQVAVMFIDIDDFRHINDGMGLVIGDELVMNFGQFLNGISSENCIVSHFNGDLYCIAIYNPVGANSVESIYQAIKDRTRRPFLTSDGREIAIKITAGVAWFPDSSEDVFELINCAEIVMLRGKHNNKGSIHYFDSAILSEFLHNVVIENKLRKAVFDMNFQMYYQPQYDTKTKELRGVEALIRWRDSEEGMISPALFIPLAEKNGTIVPIGQWVLEESIRTYMRWRREIDKPFILSINISAIQYKRDDFVDKLIHIIEKHGMNPADLELEITETTLIDNYREIISKLAILKEYGIRISMDDFGTGYSSLAYLKNLPINTLKIDKAFVDSVLDEPNTTVIMESIMTMAARLGLETVAEGVETEAQYDYLESIGCDNIQGFLLGKPQPEDDIRKLLLKQS